MSSQDKSTDYYTSDDEEPYVSTVQFGIQDMNHMYAPKYTRVHSLDTRIPTSQICVHEVFNGMIYSPIQNLPPLCDNPTMPWHYINDCRPHYPKEPYISIVPQLIIHSTPYYPLQSLTPNKQNVYDTAVNLAGFYEDREAVYGIATVLLAKLYMNALSQARSVRDMIRTTTAAILQHKKHLAVPADFGSYDAEPSCIRAARERLDEQLANKFVGLKPYADSDIAKDLKAPFYAIDWDEYDEFKTGGGPFDSYLLQSHERLDCSTACQVYTRVSNDLFDSVPDIEEHLCVHTDAVFYRQSDGFSFDSLATLPHADYIIVRPIPPSDDSPVSPLIVKPLGRWYTTYELLIKLSESLMLRDPDFGDDYFRKSKQKYSSVKERFENCTFDDPPGKCSVCNNAEFSSYIQHVSSTQHMRNYLKELNRLFRPSFLETDEQRGATGDDFGSTADEYKLLHRAPTYLEYVKRMSKRMELKNLMLSQLSYLANCIATRENVDYSLACDAVTRSCYSLGVPLILDAGDKPVKVTDTDAGEGATMRDWLFQMRAARAHIFETVEGVADDPDSDERCTLESQILYALGAIFEEPGHFPRVLPADNLPELLANESKANRRHLLKIFLCGEDVRSSYSAAPPAQRMGLCNFINFFSTETCLFEENQQERLPLTQVDVTALITEFKDYEIGVIRRDGVMARLAQFARAALAKDPLFPAEELFSHPSGANSDRKEVDCEGPSPAPPDIYIPNLRRMVPGGRLEVRADLDLSADSSTREDLINELQQHSIYTYAGLLEEVDRFLDITDEPNYLPLEECRSTSFCGFSNCCRLEGVSRNDVVFSNSFDMGAGISRDCYSMHLLHTDLDQRTCIDHIFSDTRSSQLSSVYSSIVPAQIGPRSYLNACIDLHTQVVDSLVAYNGASLIKTADAVAIALNATRIVRTSVADIAKTESMIYLPESRTVLRKTLFPS